MANEIRVDGWTANATLYSIVERLSDGFQWRSDTSVFEASNPANHLSYVVGPGTVDASGRYRANFPAGIVTSGLYQVRVRQRDGAAAALTDTFVSSRDIEWDGTKEVLVQSRALGDAQGRTTVAALTTNAIDGASIKDDAVTKLQNGLGTLANQTTLINRQSAQATAIAAIQNNTSTRLVVAPMMELPDTGTSACEVDLLIYDDGGNMEAPDSLPTITVRNATGVDRSSKMSALSTIGTGHYRGTYTLDSADPVEQLTFFASVVEGGATRTIAATSNVVNADITGTAAKVNGIFADYARRTGDYAATGAAMTLTEATLEQVMDAVPVAVPDVIVNVEQQQELTDMIALVNAILPRMPGLLGENSGMRNIQYSTVPGLTKMFVSMDIFTYDSDTNAATNDGVTGVVEKYTITRTFDPTTKLPVHSEKVLVS
jgi:hypothetical protein